MSRGSVKRPGLLPDDTLAELQREAIDAANAAVFASASARAARRLVDPAEASRFEAEARKAYKRRRRAEGKLSAAVGARVVVSRREDGGTQ